MNFDRVIANHPDFSGVILIKQGEDTLLSHAGGYAQRADKIPNNSDTRFGIASGCKGFTAVAICQLVEQGKLSFDARLSELVAYEFPHFDPTVTVHHLLSHTSGVADYFDEEVMDDFEALWLKYPTYTIKSSADFLPLFQNEPQKYPAGEKFAYNNSGYILLGLILEAVTGMLFTDYVQTHIFEPIGMDASGYFAMNQLPVNTARGYIRNEGEDGYRTNIFSVPIVGGADGGAYVTAADMHRFWSAFYNDQLVSKASRELMLTRHATDVVKEDWQRYYGYGFWLMEDGTRSRTYLVGQDPGVSFVSSYLHQHDLQMTVLSNYDSGASAAWAVEQDLLNAID